MSESGTRKESAVWWVRYRQHGKTLRQSTETADERKAREFLRQQDVIRDAPPERRPIVWLVLGVLVGLAIGLALR